MTDCGLTEMVKTSKTKFELWFRKQTASFTYVMEVSILTVSSFLLFTQNKDFYRLSLLVSVIYGSTISAVSCGSKRLKVERIVYLRKQIWELEVFLLLFFL